MIDSAGMRDSSRINDSLSDFDRETGVLKTAGMKRTSKRNCINVMQIKKVKEFQKLLQSADLDLHVNRHGVIETNLVTPKEKTISNNEDELKKTSPGKRQPIYSVDGIKNASLLNEGEKNKKLHSDFKHNQQSQPNIKTKSKSSSSENEPKLKDKSEIPKESEQNTDKSSLINEQIPKPEIKLYGNKDVDSDFDRPSSRMTLRSSSASSTISEADASDLPEFNAIPDSHQKGGLLRNRPRKLITRPDTTKSPIRHIADAPQIKPREPSAPKPAISPPRARNRSNSSASNSSASSANTDEAPPRFRKRRHNPYLLSSDGESEKSDIARPRRSPIRQPPQSPESERMVEMEADNEEEDESENRRAKQFPQRGPLVSESSDKKASQRPPPLVVSGGRTSRETRRVNAQLDSRNAADPREDFVLAEKGGEGLSRTGQAYPAPAWDIEVWHFADPSDAVYVHQLQATFSMSSIMNGLKRNA